MNNISITKCVSLSEKKNHIEAKETSEMSITLLQCKSDRLCYLQTPLPATL
jgi:hypothetical protein